MKFVALSVALTILVSIAGNWSYNHWFASEQTFANQQSLDHAKAAADQQTPAARTSVEPRRNDGGPWVSPEVIDIPIEPDIETAVVRNGYPGDDRAAFAAVTYQSTGAQAVDYLKFTLTGMHYNPSRIVAIKAIVDDRKEPPTGTVFFALPQGTTTNEALGIDLASNDLNARALQDGKLTGDHYFDLKTTTLAKGESIGYRVDTFVPTFGTDIYFHVEVTFDSGPPLEIKDNGGKPFRVVSYPRTAERAYTYAQTDFLRLGLYPCSWPTQCMGKSRASWPFN